MAPSRRGPAQQPPDADTDYSSFPSRTLSARRLWYRHHTFRADAPDYGAWWFSSSPGRFDLAAPAGTCYLASTPAAAVMELVGPSFVRHGWVPSDLLMERVVSGLTLPGPVRASDCARTEARAWRMTNELTTTSDYSLTQAWARVFRRDGFGGVFGSLRFSPGRARGLALFGPSGAPDPTWDGDTTPIQVEKVVRDLRIPVVGPPRLGDVSIVVP